jgi:hypothetical protein
MTDEIEVPAMPVIVHQGRYRLYKKPDGTLRIQYRRDDKDEDDHLEIPGFMVTMAENLSSGKMNPLQAISMIRKQAAANGHKLRIPRPERANYRSTGYNRTQYRQLDYYL